MASRYVLLTVVLILGLALLPGAVGTAGGTLKPPLIPTRFDDPTPDGCAPDDCSLREAIMAANELDGTDKIELSAGTFILSIEAGDEDTPATGDLDVTSSLTLSGAGQDDTIIDGAGIDRVLQVGHNFLSIKVEISDLTVRGGQAQKPGRDSGNGGGVFVSGDTTATLLRVGVLDNMASAQGGGIYNAAGPRFGSLTLIECTISGNQEGTDHGGSIPGGGGIHNEGAATLISTTVSDNSAHATDGGISNIGDMVIEDSLITGNSAIIAGGIGNGGNLSLSNTIVSGNTANLGAGLEGVGTIDIRGSSFIDNVAEEDGGAIRFTTGGQLTIENSTFSGNSAGENGGAIYESSSGSLQMTNVTFSGNIAGGAGGAMYLGFGTVRLANVTLVNNQSAPEVAVTSGVPATSPPVEPPGPPPQGGAGIYVQVADVSLTNTLVATNTGGDNCSGAIASLGHNLDDGTSCGFAAPGDISGEDPLLGPLADNGGPTLTHALLPGSPAIDSGDDVSCPSTDQRGLGRPVDGDGDGSFLCDIGAFEFGADTLPTPTPQPTATPTITPTPTVTPTPQLALSGDVNCSGSADAIDAVLILQHNAALVSTLPCIENADVNNDGQVNSVDAALVLQAVAGLIPST